MSNRNFNRKSERKRKNETKSEIISNKKVCHEDNSHNDASIGLRRVVQRKFPGPAGLLTSNDLDSEKQSWKELSLINSTNIDLVRNIK